ncbi:MAG: CBS domain-containing protein [Polyangia bacterium]
MTEEVMDKHNPRTLPIRTRRVLAGNGEATMTRTVLCPQHGEAVTLSLCGECPRCLRVDQDGVQCAPDTPHPSMRWASRLHRILSSAADRVAIADVMSRDVACVQDDVSIDSLRALLRDRAIGAVPVVDGLGYPIGVVSKSDLLRESAENEATVAEMMTPMAYTLREDDPLSRAAAVMTVEHVHHLPVVAADGRVVGMLSSLDFARWVAAQSAFVDEA